MRVQWKDWEGWLHRFAGLHIVHLEKKNGKLYNCHRIFAWLELAEIIDDDENVSLLVFSRLSTVEGTDSQVSYEDFMEENNADFVIYIVTTKDYDSVEEPLKQLMEKYPDLTGVVEYWDNVSNETLGEFKEMAKDATTLTGQMQFLLKTDGTCIEF